MKLTGPAWAAPAVAVAALTLSGCSALTPGTAASVDGQRITMSQVDDLSKAQCDALEASAKSAQAGQTQALPISDVKRRSLGLLIDTQLSRRYAESKGAAFSKQVAQIIYSQSTQGIDQLPSSARATLSDAFHAWAEAQAGVVDVAARASGETPSEENVQNLFDAGMAQRQKWQKGIEIKTDPRFAPGKSGLPDAGDGSVSQASSSFAKGGVASQVAPAWVNDLPSSQKCG